MKLSKLYSNDPRFHNIEFTSGINIVLGKVTQRYDMQRDSHNLGKSTLVTLLDFMLLKELTQQHIFRRFIDQFSTHVFFLEILLSDGRFLTIKRSIAEPTKISYKFSEAAIVCNEHTIWDISLTFDKAKAYLNETLAFNVLPEWDYRKTVTFFLRSQNDYSNVFQLGKYINGKHKDWKPFVFELLGYDNKPLIQKYELDQQIADVQTAIDSISGEMSLNTDDYDKIKSSLEIKETECMAMRSQIDAFNFYAEERSLNRDLIEDIERNIAELNSREYSLSYNLDKTKQSIENIPVFDMAQLQEIYAEVQIYFPESITKGYEDLLDFNKKVTQERNQYLREQILQIEDELKAVRFNLEDLNRQRNIALQSLQDKDTFHKFKEYQKRLAQLEGEIARLTMQLQNIDKLSALTEKSDELKSHLKSVSKQIVNEVKSQANPDTLSIKRLFNDIFRTIFGVSALLYVKTNAASNVEFHAEVAPDEDAAATAEGDGNTYNKMMCVAFDLAILATYSEKSYFHFVYHDGVLEGLDNRKKELFIRLAMDFCRRYNIQYIFSTIEDDIPVNVLSQFTEQEICLLLEDHNDVGKLFGFSF